MTSIPRWLLCGLRYLVWGYGLQVAAFGQVRFPGPEPGPPHVRLNSNRLVVENKALRAQWLLQDSRMQNVMFTNKITGQMLNFKAMPLFELHVAGGKTYSSTDFRLVRSPQVRRSSARPGASRLAGHFASSIVSFSLSGPAGLEVSWAIELETGANYIRQRCTIRSRVPLKISRIDLIKLPDLPEIKPCGTVDGVPLVYRQVFLALEHPMSRVVTAKDSRLCFLERQELVTPQRPLTCSVVWGICMPGQLRRSYLYYVERERAAPYHQVLHYNSWYDLSWTDRKLDEQQCLDRIQTFADSLILKRHVPLQAFLFDDGWDDNRTLWQFNANFPRGFTPLAARAARYHAGLGVWISPWGGYLEDQVQRLKFGREQDPPFEQNAHGFSLAGPVYYHRFKEVASRFVTKHGVSLFKFDGVGAGNGTSGATIAYQQDVEALLGLIGELRLLQPGLYFSLTVGTWPSVYWLNYGDVIWRAGKDTYTSGSGSKRQQWITYRDGQAYKNIVSRAPLYPLNALMYHGICIAGNGPPASFGMNEQDIADEIWSFFATGTSLQELYINPHQLSSADWDVLAQASKWAKANEEVMPDVHWVGGDPERGEVYGYAAWAPKKGTISLRNPGPQPCVYTLGLNEALEVPRGIPGNYRLKEVYPNSGRIYAAEAGADKILIELGPYQVKVFDVTR